MVIHYGDIVHPAGDKTNYVKYSWKLFVVLCLRRVPTEKIWLRYNCAANGAENVAANQFHMWIPGAAKASLRQ